MDIKDRSKLVEELVQKGVSYAKIGRILEISRQRVHQIAAEKKGDIWGKVHGQVHRAVKNSIIQKQPCEKCGETKLVHAHHDDYAKPLDVRWLCPAHHKQVHTKPQKERHGYKKITRTSSNYKFRMPTKKLCPDCQEVMRGEQKIQKRVARRKKS